MYVVVGLSGVDNYRGNGATMKTSMTDKTFGHGTPKQLSWDDYRCDNRGSSQRSKLNLNPHNIPKEDDDSCWHLTG